jgi:DNA polymerase-3 subunit alpha
MWIKEHHVARFFSSFLSNEADKAPAAMREARLLGVGFAGPDINHSDRGFVRESDRILFGLSAVKYLGDVGYNAVIKNRPYTSYVDFCQKIRPKEVNKRAKQSLIRAGAFDLFGQRDDLTLEQKVAGEKEALGVAFSTSQLDDELYDLIDERIITEDEFSALPDKETVTIGGEIINVKKIKTKKGDPMAFIDVCHGTNYWSCTVFPPAYQAYKDVIIEQGLILVRGRKDEQREQVIVNAICTVQELADAVAGTN